MNPPVENAPSSAAHAGQARIPFNKPYLTGKELHYVAEAHGRNMLAGDGVFTQRCSDWLERRTGCSKALLTHSCTAALEMAAILADIQPGDEVIMPSYTFVSTANAFVLRGGVPVFVDIRPDTLNIDESLIEAAITPRTKAIVPVHYAGVACQMDAIMETAGHHELLVIEDAAQGVMADHNGAALGSIGHFGCYSFHETKNIISGEGGALLVNDPAMSRRAEIIREKGTNRSEFFRGQVDKYTWVDVGSSYLPGEIIAAFLWAQMEEAEAISARRLAIWHRYHDAFAGLEADGRLRRPVVPTDCRHNGHMYYLLLRDLADRTRFIDSMKSRGVNCVFHYVPLHTSAFAKGVDSGGCPRMRVAGARGATCAGSLPVTEEMADRIVRLPFHTSMTEADQKLVIRSVMEYARETDRP